MKTMLIRIVLLMALSLIALGLAACQSDRHRMIEGKPNTTMSCRECYDEIVTVRSLGRWEHNQSIRTHHCAGCKSDLSIYDQGGVLMVRCAGCTPDGVPCDKCLPPEGAKGK